MAISSNAMTLAEYAQLANVPMITKVVYSLREAGSAWTDIPFATRKTMLVSGARWTGNLPTVNWVKLNVAPTAVTGIPQQFQEQAFVIRNTIEVDHLMVEDQNQIVEPRGARLGAYLRSVAYDFNDKYINNDHTTGNADAIVGLRARLDDWAKYGTVGTVGTTASSNKIDAGGLDITVANATATLANKFLKLLDDVLYAVDALDGSNVTIYCNNDLLIRIPFLIRLLGAGAGFSTAQDAYGRMVYQYRNAVLKDIGLKADQTTKIITSTETSAGAAGSSTYTSLYAVRYGEEYVSGWQFAPLNAQDLGKDPTDGVVYRTFIEWAGGLVVSNIRSIARLYGLKLS